jgi:lipoprotein-anchoring transpeptidase ErfK/SrfK
MNAGTRPPLAVRPRGPSRISRRDFLRLSVASAFGLLLPPGSPSAPWTWAPTEGQLGRVLLDGIQILHRPFLDGEQVDILAYDDVVPIRSAVIGGEQPAHNRVWYEIPERGYVHSAWVQPVRNDPQPARASASPRDLLAEVSIPFVDACAEPKADSGRVYRLYYGTTHWITAVEKDRRGDRWYRIFDDRFNRSYYAPGAAFRIIPPSELTPISPATAPEEKRIEVSLSGQSLQCFEGSHQVFIAKVSTGMALADGSFFTPEGEFETFRKRASRHMAAGDLINGYDLPGVPWVAYFTENGVALHGTYWHNDFGAARSHGCVNLATATAKWIFRWTMPVVPPDKIDLFAERGTKVIITR